MTAPFDTSDIIAGLVGLGLVAKGIMDKVYAQKSKDRPCSSDHRDLERKVDGVDHKVDTVITILNERKHYD
jgi:hypothetical protein